MIDDLKVYHSVWKHFSKEKKALLNKIYTHLISLGVHSIYSLDSDSGYICIDQILFDYDLKHEL